MTDKLGVPVSFGAPRVVTADDGSLRITVPTDGERGGARIAASLHRPGVVRDGLLVLGDVLLSDLRRQPKDRAEYLAYLLKKGKKVGKAVWDAQKEYLALTYSAAAKTEQPLDPVLSIGPDALRFEVMSRDESTYAQLVLRRPAALADDSTGGAGTTYVDFAAAFESFKRIRSYRSTTLDLAPAPDGTATAHTRSVPLRWLRAFGQMQAATLLAADRFELAPIDLYNVLLQLRMKRAKTSPRGLRYELVPGEPPRLVLEPWELTVRATGGAYRGSAPRVIRTWGRHRLSVLARILPHARRVSVTLAGPGLPAVYAVDLGDSSLSLALSGWTDAGWAGIATFDLLAAEGDPRAIDAITGFLAQRGPATEAAIADGLGRPRPEVRRTLLAALAQLDLGHDLATGELFVRPLTATPVPASTLRFRDVREAAAHRLLADDLAVTLTKVADQGIEGVAIEGQVVDAKAHRTFHPAFTLDREGRTASARCTCNAFRRSGIKEGPCEHMIAVRVAYAREQAAIEASRATPEGRAQITAETRTLFRSTAKGSETYRLSLDGRSLTARFGVGQHLRMQHQRFDSADDARAAYFERLANLAAKGYLDASQD